MKRIPILALVTLSCVMLFTGCDGNYTVPTYTDTMNDIQTNVGREFIIALDANPTTGYNWDEEYDETLIALISKEYKTDEEASGLAGAGGTQYYRFQAKHTGNTEIKLTYRRSWESAAIEENIYKVNIEAKFAKGGVMATREFQIEGFSKIEVSAAFEVEIIQGQAYAVSVTSDDFEHVRVEKRGDTLVIGRRGIEWFAPFHQQPQASITVPSIESISLSGASKGKVKDVQTSGQLTINVSGASNLETTNLSAATFKTEVTGASNLTGFIKVTGGAQFEISGASKVVLTGEANKISANVSGASRAELYEFPTQNADMEISGASNVYVNLNGRLDANVSGASNLTWTGNAVMGELNVTGASNLRHK